MSKSFYEFFYTHLQQIITAQNGLRPWLGVVKGSDNSLNVEEDQLNNVYLSVSQYQPKGDIELSIEEGQYLLDASSTVSVNTTRITVDTTLQPIDTFTTSVASPLKPAKLRRKLHYTLSNYDVDIQYPLLQEQQVATGIYPFQKVKKVITVDNPWLIQPIDYRKVDLPADPLVFSSLTVDSTLIRVNDTSIDGDISPNAELTADKISFYKPVDPDQTRLDVVPVEGDAKVFFEKIPVGTTIASWTVESQVVSQLWLPTTSRGYLPSSHIGKNMRGASLHEIALGLITLTQRQDPALLISVLQELTYIWSTKLNKGSVTPGLPSYLPRVVYKEHEALGTSRSCFEQAWLGYAITQALKLLRDQKVSSRYELPKGLLDLTFQLADALIQAIDVVSGSVYVGFDEYGYRIEEPDPTALPIVQLFLQQLLEVKYDYSWHYACASLYLRLSHSLHLDDLQEGLNTKDTPVSLTSFVIYKLWWNTVQGLHPDTPALQTELIDRLAQIELYQPHQLSTFEHGLWHWTARNLQRVNHQLPLLTLFNAFDSRYYPVVQDVYGDRAYQTSIAGLRLTPDFTATNWTLLLQSTHFTFPRPSFDLYALSARAFQTFGYLEARRMCPFGYAWAAEEAEYAHSGKLGALLYGKSHPLYGWFLLYSLVSAGRFLTTSQGTALDLWGRDLNYARPPGQSDSFYRQTLLARLNQNQSTKSSLTETVQLHYQTPLLIKEPEVLSVQVNNVWTPFAQTNLSQITRSTLVKTPKPLYPALNRLSDVTQTKSWVQTVPHLQIYLDEYLPNLATDLLSNMSAGVDVTIELRLCTQLETYTFAKSSFS